MKLTEIQANLKAPKTQFNSFGKYHYRSCEDILEAVKPLLGTSVLTLTDQVKEAGGIIYIEAEAVFNDGEITTVKACAGIDVNKKGMDYSQAFGAASSYARKYALNGLFLIDDTKDADSTNTHGKETKSEWVYPNVGKCENLSQLEKVWNENIDKHSDKIFCNEVAKRKSQLK